MNDRQLQIKLEGPAVKEGRISFTLLGRILHGIQQTMHYLALAGIQYDYRQRIRVPRDVQKACRLYRVVEQKGSYELTAEIAPPVSLGGIEDLGGHVKDTYLDLTRILSQDRDWGQLQALLPDSVYRRKVLRSVAEYCPKRGENWSLGVGIPDNPFYPLKPGFQTAIHKYLVQPMTEYRALTGELVQLHLDENKLGIYYQPAQRVVHCIYDPELEDFIVSSLRQLVQVYGQVQLDERGMPAKIADVVEIDSMDMSPLEFSSLHMDGRCLLLTQELEMGIDFDQEAQEFFLEWPELNIVLGSQTREELWEELVEDIFWLWDEYGKSDVQALSDDA
jgi:hypothetical protein